MNHAANDHRRQGFTIVELLISMTFVTMLLLTIAVTVIQIANIYNKGLTMRAVDQAGRSINADIRQTLAQSQPFDSATAFHLQPKPNDGEDDDSEGGRLCTGTYSYIWNFGKALSKHQPVNRYSTEEDEIRFVRVRDNGGEYCADTGKAIVRADATELLSTGDRDLAIQSFSIERLAEDPAISQALYRIVMVIGTNNQDSLERSAALTTLDVSCRPPSDDSSLQEYCAVNRFDFTAQAGNRGGQ